MKKQKIATVVTCCALVGAIAVGGTLALLSAPTSTLKNTFTVGEGYPGTGDDSALKLKENAVVMVDDTNSAIYEKYNFGDYAKTGEVKVASSLKEEGNTYKSVIAGAHLDKNPWFTLEAKSPASWIIAKVDGVTKVKNAGITIDNVTADPLGGWYKVEVSEANGKVTNVEIAGTAATTIEDGYYLYKAATDAKDGKVTTTAEEATNTAPLFTRMTAGDTLTKTEDLGITIKGVAVQATDEMHLDNSKVAVMQAAVDKLG